MTPAYILTALFAVFVGWIGADALDWSRRRRASKGTGTARQIGTPADERAKLAEFPNRAVRRRAAKQMTAQLMRQASEMGRRMTEQRAPEPAAPPAPTLRERVHAWARFKRTPRRPKGVLT